MVRAHPLPVPVSDVWYFTGELTTNAPLILSPTHPPLDDRFLMGSVLSLLLVFRTNSAYDRFWEARRQLGNLMQISRSLGA